MVLDTNGCLRMHTITYADIFTARLQAFQVQLVLVFLFSVIFAFYKRQPLCTFKKKATRLMLSYCSPVNKMCQFRMLWSTIFVTVREVTRHLLIHTFANPSTSSWRRMAIHLYIHTSVSSLKTAPMLAFLCDFIAEYFLLAPYVPHLRVCLL